VTLPERPARPNTPSCQRIANEVHGGPQKPSGTTSAATAPHARPLDVVVGAGQTTSVVISYDSGIR
jgi:hypothetical protein